jgi:hypothetical protein
LIPFLPADISGDGIQHAACSGKVRSFLQDFPAA